MTDETPSDGADIPTELSPEAEATIRQAARNALTRSLSLVTEERVLPRATYQPWIRMGHDYYGHAVEHSEGELSRALTAALPERFEWRRRPAVDHAGLYPSALLEAAVAAATLADEPYDVDSPSMQRAIDELIATVQRAPRATVLQVVTDVDVEHPPVLEGHEDALGELIDVAGVHVIRVANRPEPFIERELPSAGYEVDRGEVFVFPGPAALLVAGAQRVADFETLTVEARRRVNLLVAAIRLATASTVHPIIEIAGEPGQLHTVSPEITPFRSWGVRWIHRPVTIAPGDAPGYEALVSLIDSWADETGWIPVRIALGRLGRSLDGTNPGLDDQVVDLAIGLEAALAGTDKSEVGLRLRGRAAALLAADDDPPEAIYRDVKTLYELRSTFVHGGSLRGKDVTARILGVTGVAATTWGAERYPLALDRWRDLLRRAILARIALATAAQPWFGRSRGLDVDELLLRGADRGAWRDHIEAFWADRGLGHALRPATPALLMIGGPDESSP